jgi:hypothetical protein
MGNSDRLVSYQKRGVAMKLILTIALSALMLSGCVAQWPSDRTGARNHQGPLILPMSTPAP